MNGMTELRRGAWWGAALGLLAGAAALVACGAGADGWQTAARWTARLSAACFVAMMLTGPAPSPSLRTRTAAFAAAHLVHLAALAAYNLRWGGELDALNLAGGALAYAAAVAMVFAAPDRYPRIHRAGTWYLWLLFTLAFAKRLALPGREAAAAAGAGILILAALVRLWPGRKRAGNA